LIALRTVFVDILTSRLFDRLFDRRFDRFFDQLFDRLFDRFFDQLFDRLLRQRGEKMLTVGIRSICESFLGDISKIFGFWAKKMFRVVE
jgi:predicted component of type VI protein secretion system